MARLALHFLGTARIEYGGSSISLDTRKALALLAYLAITGKPCARDNLALLFWPESDTKHARGTLRWTLSALRKALPGEFILADRESVATNPDQEIWLDVAHFRRLLGRASQPPLLPALQEAIDLYRGDFLAGLSLPDSPSFEEWLFFEREGMRREYASALQGVVALLIEQQQFEQAVPFARQWVNLDPLNEPAQRELMWLYARLGQQAAAIRQYEECRALLAEELGVPPSGESRLLYEQILAGSIEMGPPPPGTERATLAGSAPAPSPAPSLPPDFTPFVGREHELAELAGLLAAPHCRLLTLTGPGGSGKSRLALQLAREQAASFQDGAIYVDLAPLSTASQLPSRIVDGIGLPLHDSREARKELLRYLCERELLLLLDNFEHLLEGIELVIEIIARAERVKVLVTSRESLNVEGEQLYPVGGLAVPEQRAGTMSGTYSAVALFVQRARQARLDFSLEEEEEALLRICRLVAGLPLGIELAAAWVKLFSCAEIAGEIASNLDFLTSTRRSANPRHRSLRAVFEHSWKLLPPQEQHALMRLSIFRGGFDREAARQVAGATLFTLSSLLDKSLLQRLPEGRYTLHELLRNYLAEKLQADGTEMAALQERYTHYFAEFVEQTGELWNSPREPEATAIIRTELENIRLAWHLALERLDLLERYIEEVYFFYMASNWFEEGLELFRQAISAVEQLAEEPRQQRILARLMTRQADLAYPLGLTEQALDLLNRSLAIQKRYQDDYELGAIYRLLGNVARLRGNYLDAIHFLERALHHAIQAEDRGAPAHIYLSLGAVALTLGEYEEARERFQKSLALFRALGKEWGMAYCLRFLGEISQVGGEHEKAEQLQRRGLSLFAKLNDRIGMTFCLDNLGRIAQEQGQYGEARQWYQRSLAISREHGFRISLPRTLGHLGYLLTDQGRYDEARSYLEEALAVAVEARMPFMVLYLLLGTTEVATRELLQAGGPTHLPAAEQVQEATTLFQILTFLANHPASTHTTRERAALLRDRLEQAVDLINLKEEALRQVDKHPLEEWLSLLLTSERRDPSENLVPMLVEVLPA